GGGDISHEPHATTAGTEVYEALRRDLVALPGGTFRMGTDFSDGFPTDGEGPVRPVTVGPFRISRHAVTNRQLQTFVAATGYVAEAERCGWAFVFRVRVQDRGVAVRGSSGAAPWWLAVDGARWQAPEGPGSSVERRLDHPVVH